MNTHTHTNNITKKSIKELPQGKQRNRIAHVDANKMLNVCAIVCSPYEGYVCNMCARRLLVRILTLCLVPKKKGPPLSHVLPAAPSPQYSMTACVCVLGIICWLGATDNNSRRVLSSLLFHEHNTHAVNVRTERAVSLRCANKHYKSIEKIPSTVAFCCPVTLFEFWTNWSTNCLQCECVVMRMSVLLSVL